MRVLWYLILILLFHNCVIKRVECGKTITEIESQNKQYTIHVISSQNCGYCHLLIGLFNEIDICGSQEYNLVYHETVLSSYPEKTISDIDLSIYPQCAEVRVIDECDDKLSKLYPTTFIVDNRNNKVIKKIRGYYPNKLRETLNSVSN